MVEYGTFALACADELVIGDKLAGSHVTVYRIQTDIDPVTAGAGRSMAVSYRLTSGETYRIACRKDDAVAIRPRTEDRPPTQF